ncbi:hypothetical protein EJ06DRAFT_58571 [Trichodelitschia bisporula]|uniref:Uncharacterized protein n=1 Tax=Trichodelitschia bisporula TaxID=703511 RepID=A0A6G1HU46_9PEZI|nr:hypothetical protein EJ06DRAFT_58571 [Trichodelitschia bisporula]
MISSTPGTGIQGTFSIVVIQTWTSTTSKKPLARHICTIQRVVSLYAKSSPSCQRNSTWYFATFLLESLEKVLRVSPEECRLNRSLSRYIYPPAQCLEDSKSANPGVDVAFWPAVSQAHDEAPDPRLAVHLSACLGTRALTSGTQLHFVPVPFAHLKTWYC